MAGVGRRLRHPLERLRTGRPTDSGHVLVVDLYPGADREEIVAGLSACRPDALVVDPAACLKPAGAIEAMLGPFLTEDRVFGVMSTFLMGDFFDAEKLQATRLMVEEAKAAGRTVLVAGTGAGLVHDGDLLAQADMPRWEIQLRFRKGMGNWTGDTSAADFLAKYKRGFFVEWRTADRHKFGLFERTDFFLDTTVADSPKLVAGAAMREALAAVVRGPFRVVPFFDPGVWGGQWMRDAFDLPANEPNYAWGFDCVPEENSLRLAFGDIVAEVPSLNVVVRHAEALLGRQVVARFGAEFPIRFDFLDTIDGGNLSLQVHPTAAYIRQAFGMSYTQDESYYILEAGEDAAVYLGFRDGIDVGGFPRCRRGCTGRRPAARCRTVRQSHSRPGSTITSRFPPARSTARAATASSWRSAPRPTSSPSSYGTGAVSGWTAGRARSTSRTARRCSTPSATPTGSRPIFSVRSAD